MDFKKFKLLLRRIHKPLLNLLLGFGLLVLIASIIFLIWKAPEYLLPDSLLEIPSVTTNDSTIAVYSTAANSLNETKLTLKPKELLELRNEYRRTIYQMVAGVILLFGLYLTYRRITATERSVEVAQEGQITERFTRAVEQLGDQKLEIRIGGIYALERIAIDSEKDHWTVMEILSAYVRERASIKKKPDKQEKAESERTNKAEELPELSTDIQAILTVIGRRKWIDTEKNRIDLSSTNLANSNLSGANLSTVNLSRAELSGADFSNANLIKANLRGANLIEAKLIRVNLSRANLNRANLFKADLRLVRLYNANLFEANLTGAKLSGANLTEAKLTGADLHLARLINANLINANLTQAKLIRANLTEAILTGAELRAANFTGAKLSGANLTGANLSEAKLTQANLIKANLTEAKLINANLFKANLSEAKLSGANLTIAELSGADLTRTYGLTAEQLIEANGWDNSILDFTFRGEIEELLSKLKKESR